jgi:hypothetical protein
VYGTSHTLHNAGREWDSISVSRLSLGSTFSKSRLFSSYLLTSNHHRVALLILFLFLMRLHCKNSKTDTVAENILPRRTSCWIIDKARIFMTFKFFDSSMLSQALSVLIVKARGLNTVL